MAQVIGAGLGLLDEWSTDPVAAVFLARAGNPSWNDRAQKAAELILEFARSGNAFGNLRTLIVTHSGLAILEGTALAVAGTAILWADFDGEDIYEVTAR